MGMTIFKEPPPKEWVPKVHDEVYFKLGKAGVKTGKIIAAAGIFYKCQANARFDGSAGVIRIVELHEMRPVNFQPTFADVKRLP